MSLQKGTVIGVCDKCWEKHCDKSSDWEIEQNVREDERDFEDNRCWIKRCRQARMLGYTVGARKKLEKKEEKNDE